ncbi:MAG: GYD domain-containing protein [Alphaproteobacteria bacterium]|nr:GYD domain-containing protein [Alphaproteobacteria bacterium]
MPYYLIQADYSEAGSKHLVDHPQHREAALAKTCEALGGRMLHFFYSFGDFDAVVLAELPDNQAAAAISLSADAAGGVRRMRTTVLMTPAEAIEAMQRAKTDQYAPPA